MRVRQILIRGALVLAVLVAVIATGRLARAETQHVRDVRLSSATPDTSEVLVATSGKPQFTARVEGGGLRLVVDIDGADVAGAPAAITKSAGVVGGVLTQAFANAQGRTTRVLVTLLKQAEFRVLAEEDGLRVVLKAAAKTGAMGASGPLAPKPAQAVSTSEVSVSNVRFDHQEGRDRVIVELSSIPAYADSTVGSDRSVLELKGAVLPDALQRKLDVAAFGGPVKAVSTYKRSADPTHVVIEIDRSSQARGAVSREGNTLVFTFQNGAVPSTVTGVAADGGAARKSRTVAREDALADAAPRVEQNFEAAAGAQESTVEPDQADAYLPGVAAQQRRQRAFTGRRIDLDLKDAPIHEVLRLLADVGKVSVVTSDGVTGTVTIRMKNVPWDQALETVLQAKKLGMVRNGTIIRVAPLDDLNKERELAIARRKAELQLAPLETRIIPVSYADAKELQDRTKELLSPRGTISVDERTSVLIVRDVAGNLNQIEELVRTLDTQTPQVLIEARIVEATSRYLRDVGIQWGGDASFSPATGNPTGLAFPSSVGVVGGASDSGTPTAGLSPFQNQVTNPNFAVNLPATVGTGQGGAIGLSLGSINNAVNLAVRLSAAEASGMLRIVSSPRILTLDNRDARISQGTLIPFSQISAQGVQTVFQEAKLQLLVKPHVTAEGSVAMHVRINRDEPDFNQTSARGDPTILKREAETDLLILDGHTAVIGGIFTRNTGRNLDQVPLLGDIPILGVLFQRRRATDQRSELVIFITPRIVNRAEALGK